MKLIRTLAVTTMMSAMPIGVVAQTTLSIRGGASLATLGGNDVQSADSRTGISVGAALTFPLGGTLGLQIGGAYVQKGATETEQGVKVEFALDYFELPVLLRIGVPTSGSISPHFLVGPAVAFKAKCEVSGSGSGASVSLECGAGNVPVKSIDVGAIAGAGLDIATSGPVSVTIDVSYTLGLSSIDDSASPDDVKNRGWSFLAGVAFPLG